MQSIRARRIENEWKVLLEVAAQNAAILKVNGRSIRDDRVCFEVRLSLSGGLMRSDNHLEQITSFDAVIEFPRFFPAVPMEVFVCPPVLHPNVHPLTGFACIWDDGSAGDSVVAALQRLQRVVCWRLLNESPDHLMQQPEALDLYPSKSMLPATEIKVPEQLAATRTARAPMPEGRRRRLS